MSNDFWSTLNKKKREELLKTAQTKASSSNREEITTGDFWSVLNEDKKRELLSSETTDIAPTRTFMQDDDDIAPVKGGNKNSVFKSGGFSDGVDGVGDFFGDLGQTVLGTTADLGLGILKGAGKLVEGVVDLGTYGVAGVADLFGADEFAKKAKKVAQYDAVDEWTKGATDYVDQYSVLGNKADMVGEGIGQVGAIILTGGAAGAAGLGTAGATAVTTGLTGLSGMGSGMNDAYAMGASDGNAVAYGATVGSLEAVSEMIFGGLGKGFKALGVSKGLTSIDDVFAKKLSNAAAKFITSEAGQKVVGNTLEYAVKSGAEGLEEVISGFGSAIAKDAYLMNGEDEKAFGEILKDENLLEQFVVGSIVSGIAQGGDFISSTKNGRDFVSGLSKNEQTVVDKVFEQRLAEESENRTLSNRDKNKLYERVVEEMKRGYVTTDEIESILGGETYKGYKDLTDKQTSLESRKKAIEEEIKSLVKTPESQFTVEQREQLNSLREEAKGIKESLSNLGIKTAKNNLFNEVDKLTSKDTYLRESYNDLVRQTQDLQIDENQYNGTKFADAAKKTIENARKAKASNSIRVRDFVEFSAKYSSVSGTVVDFKDADQINKILEDQLNAKIATLQKSTTAEDKAKLAQVQEMLKDVQDGKIHVNGVKTKDGVAINLKSPNYLNVVLGHEVTHFLEGKNAYEPLQKAIFKYAQHKGDLDGRRSVLEALYENIDGTSVDYELTADLVGDYLFTEYDFIKNLSTEDRNVFQKVYDQIKYMFKLATAGSKEARELEKVMHQFERALRESTKTSQNAEHNEAATQFSLRTKPAPKKTQEVYKLMRLKDGEIYPLFIDSTEPLKVGEWYDADSPNLDFLKEMPSGVFLVDANNGTYQTFDDYLKESGERKTKYPSKKAIEKATAEGKRWVYIEDTAKAQKRFGGETRKYWNIGINGSGGVSTFSMRPGYHAGSLPTMRQIGKGANKDLRDDSFVWTVGEVPADIDYQAEAEQNPDKDIPTHIPEDGYYLKATNADKAKSQADRVGWYVAGAYKINRIISDSEARQVIDNWNAEHPDTPVEYDYDRESGMDFDADQMKLVPKSDTKYSISVDSKGNQLSPAVQKRFEKSKAVDENGDLKVLYHGTASGEFFTFDKAKGSVEGDFGSGFYFTDNEYDVERNYVDGGPDFDNKVARRAEQIEAEEDIEYSEAEARAREELYVGGNKFEVYLNIENPCIVGETNLFDYDGYASEYDPDDYDSEEDYEGDVEQLIADDIDQIIWDIERNVDIYSTDGIAEVLWNAVNEGGVGIEQLKARIAELYLEDNNGNIVGGEVVRQIIESLGYDGIIDNTVSHKFSNMGLSEDTTHYIVFKPNQIKDISNQNPTDNPDIRYSLSKSPLDNSTDLGYNVNDDLKRGDGYVRTVEFRKLQAESQRMSDEDIQLYHSGNRKIDEGLRANLARVLRGQIHAYRNGLRNDDGILSLSNEGNEFNMCKSVNGSLFHDCFEISQKYLRNGELVDLHGVKTTEDGIGYDDCDNYLSEDGLSGFSITPDGDLISVFNASGKGGFLSAIAPVVRENAKTLDCYNSPNQPLCKMYEKKFGFKTASVMDYNMEYDHDNIAANHNKPKVAFMVNTASDVETKYFSEIEYDEAKTYRDSFVNQTTDSDIAPIGNFSLSNESEKRTPGGSYHFEGKDFRVKSNEQDIAPVAEDVAENATADAPMPDEIVPMTEEEANALQDEKAKADAKLEGNPKTRKQLHSNIINDIKATFSSGGYDFDDVLSKAKDLSTFSTVDNTPQRVMEKALGYKEGQVLSDLTVNKVAQNETEGIKWLNSFTDRKNGLLAQISKQYNIKPGSKESAAAQMYAEGFYVNENNDIVAYGDAELEADFPDAKVRSNIKGLAKDTRIRQIYDETLEAINKSRTRNAYPEIQKLDNYFLHFRAMEDTFSKLGLPFNPNDIRAKDLPTDLNGVTADLKPGQPFFASAMHRKGKRTSFDLLGGLERYLTGAKNQIYHIDDIQTLRALRNYIADTYGQANGLEGIDALTEEEAQKRIEEVYNSHLSTFAKFLNEEANILAGKTSLIDRGVEGLLGRRFMTFLDTVRKQTGSNMVGYNISSSLTNFLPVAQTLAKSNKFDFLKAFAQTTSNKFGSVFGKGDNFAENSPVMIRRKGADRFYRTPFQKVGDAGYVLMGAVDNISTELIARTKFNELTRKGMSEQQAHIETDKWVSRLMGDRSLGQMPQLYNSKALGFITQFQLEVRNQLDSQFFDTIQETKVSNEEIENNLARNAKTAAKVTSTFVQLAVVQHLFGKAFESVAGYNPAFDIIDVLSTMFGFDDEEDSEDTALDNIEQGFLELLEDLPYTSALTGGRIPISSALPVTEMIKGVDSYGNEKSRLKTLLEVAPYYGLPGGYGQIKKTAQGLNMFSDEHPVSGSYTDSGNLRFPVEDTFGNRLQAGIFGQYASKNAREYFDNDYAPLKEKQIQEYMDVDLPIGDYWKYREGLKGLKTQAEKADYVNSLDIADWQKNLLMNNILDRKEDVDMSNYDDYSDWEEFDYAQKNPDKYAFAKSVGGYSAYKTYSDELYDIKADKDEYGKSISGSRKEKVLNYINNLDADYETKIILWKSEYPSDDTYNMDIINYLNNRADLTYEERVAILTELGFTVSGDTVYWD